MNPAVMQNAADTHQDSARVQSPTRASNAITMVSAMAAKPKARPTVMDATLLSQCTKKLVTNG